MGVSVLECLNANGNFTTYPFCFGRSGPSNNMVYHIDIFTGDIHTLRIAETVVKHAYNNLFTSFKPRLELFILAGGTQFVMVIAAIS